LANITNILIESSYKALGQWIVVSVKSNRFSISYYKCMVRYLEGMRKVYNNIVLQ